jgi:hypothetical protein
MGAENASPENNTPDTALAGVPTPLEIAALRTKYLASKQPTIIKLASDANAMISKARRFVTMDCDLFATSFMRDLNRQRPRKPGSAISIGVRQYALKLV